MKLLKAVQSISVIFIIVLFCLSESNAQQHYDSLKVIHMSDLHICNYDGYNPDLRKTRRKQYDDNYADFEKFLKTIPQQTHADQIITSGDNADFYEAEAVNGNAKGGQIENFLTLYKKSPVPIYLTLGNHEISTFYTKASKEKGDKKSGHYKAAEARAEWIKNVKCFENGTYYFQKVIVGDTPYLFLFLDVIYRLSEEPTDAFWNPEMLEWLNYELDTNPDSKAVMFFHIPIPVPDNNGDGKILFKPKEGWPTADTYKSGIMQTLNKHSNVKAIFVGHNHENVIEDIIFPDGKKITEVETGSFGESAENWRVLTFTKTMIKISKPGSSDCELSITMN